jgi:hypothetical protein
VTILGVLASRFDGAATVDAEALRKLGAVATMRPRRWTFPDGSKLVFIRSTWRALAPTHRRRAR